jgi:hypothetical protein
LGLAEHGMTAAASRAVKDDRSQVRRPTLFAGAAAAVLMACSGTGDPSPRLTVSFTSTLLGNETVVDSTGWPMAQCAVRVSALGTGEGKATFEGATFKWYWGLDRITPKDTATYTSTEVEEHWDTPEIFANAAPSAEWIFWSPFPFEAELTYRYRSDHASSDSEAKTRFACGPTPPTPTPAAPTITSVALAPSAGAREPGDTLVVSYGAANPGGLWATVAVAAEVFEAEKIFPELLATSTNRTARFQIPADVTIGASGAVGVFAFDAFEQVEGSGAPFEAIGDETPPTVTVGLWPPGFMPLSSTLAGRYFVGDSISLQVHAEDNHRVRSVVWQMLPVNYKDSVLVDAKVWFTQFLKIPVIPEMLGSQQLRVYARDGAGLLSVARVSQPGAFGVYPQLQRPSWTANIGARVYEVLVDTARNVAYLRHSTGISFLSLTTRQVVRSFTMNALGMDITPGGDSLIVTRGGTQDERGIVVIDLRSSEPVQTTIAIPSLDATLNQAAYGVKVAQNGKAFVALQGSASAAYRLLEIDLKTGQQRQRTDGANGGQTYGIDRSTDHAVLVVNRDTCTQRYDSATDTFGACTTMIPRNLLPTPDRAGQHFGHGIKVYGADLAFEREVQSAYDLTGSTPIATIDPSGEYVYHFLHPIGILRSRVSDGALMDRVRWPITMQFVDILRVSPDGKLMIVVEGSGTLSRVGVMDITTTIASAAVPARSSATIRAPATTTPRLQLRRSTRGGARVLP